MVLDEIVITKAIIERFLEKLLQATDVDVAIVGGAFSLVAAYYLASAGKKVALFERKLSLGGGMWGGGMMFNEIVIQDEAREILDVLMFATGNIKRVITPPMPFWPLLLFVLRRPVRARSF